MVKMMKKVAIIILNYKVKTLAIRCLESVLKSDYPNIEIFLLDNNSGDQIEDDISKYEKVTFIQNGSNLGYAKGNNLGIKRALEEGADYVFILNPDTTVNKDTIDILLTRAQQYGAGILGPKVYFGDGKTILYAGGILDKANVLGSHRGVDELDSAQYNKDEGTDYVTGAAMMVSKDVFKKIGFFDERFFLYYEDSDFCYRAKLAGFKIMYIYQAEVVHENGQSTGLGSPLQDYFITRNRMLFASKHLGLRTRFALFREALRNLGSPTRRLALFDFLVGNFGKGSFIK